MAITPEAIAAAREHNISLGCRGGGCGVCRAQVLSGECSTQRMSRRHVSEADEARGVVLACRLTDTRDLILEPAPNPPIPAGADAPQLIN